MYFWTNSGTSGLMQDDNVLLVHCIFAEPIAISFTSFAAFSFNHKDSPFQHYIYSFYKEEY